MGSGGAPASSFNTVSADLTEQSRRDGGFPSLEESLPYHRVG